MILLCGFYQQRFGDKALKCQGNCAWQGRRRSTVRSPRASPISTITAPKEGWNVRNPNTAIVFVIDTGSPHSLLLCMRPTFDHRYSGELTAANGSKISTFEHEQLHLTLGLGKSFTWDIINAGVERAILGIDFLEHFDLLLDTRQCKLVPYENIPGEESTTLPREGPTSPEVTPKEDCPQTKQASSLQELFDLYLRHLSLNVYFKYFVFISCWFFNLFSFSVFLFIYIIFCSIIKAFRLQ